MFTNGFGWVACHVVGLTPEGVLRKPAWAYVFEPRVNCLATCVYVDE